MISSKLLKEHGGEEGSEADANSREDVGTDLQ